ncbi:hypothetical protein ACSBR1_002940 [Camellia fascicularis]
MKAPIVSHDDPNRAAWFGSSNITNFCDPNGDFFQFGIYGDALNLGIAEIKFINKYLYCLWWGLRNLSSIGQNLLHEHLRRRNKFRDCHCDSGIVVFCFAYWEYASSGGVIWGLAANILDILTTSGNVQNILAILPQISGDIPAIFR